jgi:hypothetical protein
MPTVRTFVYDTDSRLTDSRTPTAHASTHKSGGSDSIKLDELAAPTDVTTLNASSTAHGLCPKLSGSATDVLRGNGTFGAAPAGAEPSGWTVIVATADQDVTNASNTSHTTFTFAATAGKLYAIEIALFYSANNATGDYEYQFAVSAGTMDGVGLDMGDTTADALATTRIAAAAAATTNTISCGGAADLGIPRPRYISYTFRQNTSNGTLNFKFGNATASAGRTSRTLNGSIFRYKLLN